MLVGAVVLLLEDDLLAGGAAELETAVTAGELLFDLLVAVEAAVLFDLCHSLSLNTDWSAAWMLAWSFDSSRSRC